jgi:parvulin-like peptidyl-prolyl isomerase
LCYDFLLESFNYLTHYWRCSMSKAWLLCVLLGTLAWGQAAPSAPPATTAPGAAPSDTAASVAPTDAVITIKGVCAPEPAKPAAKGTAAKPATAPKTAAATTTPADCKTVITKAEFEKLASALSPTVTPQLKKQMAGGLPRLLAMSDEAKKQGIDKTEQFKEAMKFVQMQVLANELQRKVQSDAANVSDEDTQKYYSDHQADFAQFNVDRVFVPRTKQAEGATLEDAGKKPSEEEQKAKQAAAEREMTKLADDLRTRAASGEDFTKLQKEAYEGSGTKIDSPTVNLPNVRRSSLPPAHAAIFDLKPGEVSQVINDTGGHYIYKLNSKTEMPVDQAKNEIHTKLQNDRIREKMEKLNNSFTVETNEAYFGPGGASPIAPPAGAPIPPRPRPAAPPHAPSAQPQAPPPAQPPGANQN